jgi:hypothetical protein
MTIQIELTGYYPHLVRKGVFRGINLAALAEKLWRLEALRVNANAALPAITWRAFSRGAAWGTAWDKQQTITMRLAPNATPEAAVEVLLHELVHCSAPGASHNELFRRRLIAAAREAFGLELDTAALLELPAGKFTCRAYAIDAAIVEALKSANVIEKLRGDVAVRFEPPPAETEEAVALRREAKAAAKSAMKKARAEAMLQKWESMLKSAQRHRAKWAKKVKYYERREAAAAKAKGE